MIWLATLAVLAAAIIVMMNVKLAGAVEPSPPRFVPDLVVNWQEAVDLFRGGNFLEARDRMQEVHGRVAAWMQTNPPIDRGVCIWNTLTVQARGNLDVATTEWERIELATDMLAWKHVAIAAMNLEKGQNDEAAEELAVAQLLDPENAIVHYYLGILHLQQAEEAIDWPDYVHKSHVRLVAHSPNVVPNTKGMYQLAATVDLEHAIDSAACLDRNTPLIPEEWTSEPMLRPTVTDLLSAMGAANFEPNAHHILGCLFLERGALEVAEEHLDQANELGVTVPFLFNDLGESYEAEGRHADAARAFLKAVRNGPNRVGALTRFLHNMGAGVREGL
jgi:Flp pilus assembly protein TadD